MGILKKWWNLIVLYFVTLDHEPVEEKKPKTPTDGINKAPKKPVKEVTVKPSAAIKMITTSIDTETDSGKKKYKARLARELNKAVDSKDTEAVYKGIVRIVKYLNK